jgi:hypothetical protein
MKRFVAFLVGISLLGLSNVYAKGPQGGPEKAGPKPYQGAGIGKEVSNATKELKGQEEKKDFDKLLEKEHVKSQEFKNIKS